MGLTVIGSGPGLAISLTLTLSTETNWHYAHTVYMGTSLGQGRQHLGQGQLGSLSPCHTTSRWISSFQTSARRTTYHLYQQQITNMRLVWCTTLDTFCSSITSTFNSVMEFQARGEHAKIYSRKYNNDDIHKIMV